MVSHENRQTLNVGEGERETLPQQNVAEGLELLQVAGSDSVGGVGLAFPAVISLLLNRGAAFIF